MHELQSDLSRQSLIVWDAQYGISSTTFNAKGMIPNIKPVSDLTYSLQIPVIYAQTARPSYENQSVFANCRMHKRGIEQDCSTHGRDTTDCQAINELNPETQEYLQEENF